MRRSAITLALAFVFSLAAAGTPANAAKTAAAPATAYQRAPLATAGTYDGVGYGAGALTLTTPTHTGTYADPFAPAGTPAIEFQSGTWTGPWMPAPFAFDELVASWNAATPPGTWIRIEMEARGSGRTTKIYTMGIWASGDADIHRTSVGGQGDADGFIAIDTFIRSKKAAALDEYRLHLTLLRAAGSSATPAVRSLGAMVSAASSFAIPSARSFSGEVDLAVPQFSQEVHAGEYPEYDGGGEAWCSPTSTAMVLRYWHSGPSAADLAAFPGPTFTGIDPEVDHAARYVYDWHYQGAGNWPDNTAYAATFGLDAFVTRLRSLDEAERFIRAGIPLVASINGKLEGFLFKKTSGHLLVIRGFTAAGDVIANDPAVMSDAEVMKTYPRASFEDAWLNGSAGIVYVIHPSDGTYPLPANAPGDANW